MSHPDTNEILYEHHGWDGKCSYDDADTTKDQDIINWLKSENAYLIGKIEVYEKFLKDRGYIKEAEYEKKIHSRRFCQGQSGQRNSG